MNDEKIKVILVKPNEVSEVAYIDPSLESMQGIVGGLIEEFMPFEDDVALICNEEGKISGLPLNRSIRAENGEIVEIIAGTFFMAYAPIESENFLSMPDNLLEKYDRRFKMPEQFFRTARGIQAIKFNPALAEKEMDYEGR